VYGDWDGAEGPETPGWRWSPEILGSDKLLELGSPANETWTYQRFPLNGNTANWFRVGTIPTGKAAVGVEQWRFSLGKSLVPDPAAPLWSDQVNTNPEVWVWENAEAVAPALCRQEGCLSYDGDGGEESNSILEGHDVDENHNAQLHVGQEYSKFQDKGND
jgi:hypothetical protein